MQISLCGSVQVNYALYVLHMSKISNYNYTATIARRVNMQERNLIAIAKMLCSRLHIEI